MRPRSDHRRPNLQRGVAFAFAAALLLSACETGRPYGTIGGGGSANLAEGSMLAASLSRADRDALYPVFAAAAETAAPGARAEWRGPSAQGSVTPGAFLIGNLKADPRTMLPLAGPVSFADPLETELGLFAIKSDANVRAAPSLEAKVLEQLPGGTGVDAVGKVVGAPWFLVAAPAGEGASVRGYVHESLLLKAPGTELELAGGPTRRASLCRAYEQRLSVGGRSDVWSGVACKRGETWEALPADPNAPERLM